MCSGFFFWGIQKPVFFFDKTKKKMGVWPFPRPREADRSFSLICICFIRSRQNRGRFSVCIHYCLLNCFSSSVRVIVTTMGLPCGQ